MQPESEDIHTFQRYRTLDGSIKSATGGRRNGRTAVFLPTSISEWPADADEPSDFRNQKKLFVNLNAVQRETWRRILCGQSISSIADEDGVSRPAIYARIEGNRFGQGGMIARNFWILLWWRLRQELHGGER